MYTPKIYLPPSSEALEEVIRNNSFGTLITTDLRATHIPMDLVKSGNLSTLCGHLSAANPQTNNLNNSRAMAVFMGPHAYISSSWYEKINVPTWNYLAVHVYGTIEVLNEEEKIEFIKTQLALYEKESVKPVKLEEMPPEFLNAHLKGIYAFRMKIESMEGSFKMSQNRNDRDYNNIIKELESRTDENSVRVAQVMKKMRPGNE